MRTLSTSFHRYLALVVCLASLVYSKQVSAQTAVGPDYIPLLTPTSDDTDGFLKLDVVVTDKLGGAITGLEPKDFTLLENDHADKILSFQGYDGVLTKPNPPVEVILLIDRMSTGETANGYVKKFLLENNGRLTQPVSVFRLFSSGLWVSSEPQPSNDGNLLAASLDHKGRLLSTWNARNSRYPSTPPFLRLRALGMLAAMERQKSGRKLLIWIGGESRIPECGQAPGPCFRPQPIFDAIVWYSTLLREARMAFYRLSVDDFPTHLLRYLEPTHSPETDSGSRTDGVKAARDVTQATSAHLDRRILAVESGGRALGVDKDLTTQINRCVREASAFYTLSFDPQSAEHPDEYHTLKVLVDKAGLTARTNTGYYDQPYYRDQPNVTLKPVTVEELRQTLDALHSRPQGEVVQQLSGLELTERLSSPRLSAWMAGLHGRKARQALIALADASVFLNPPTAEVLADAPPDAAARRQMWSRTIDYLTKTTPKLPDFFATRTTVFYRETPPKYAAAGKDGTGYQPLHRATTSTASVLVRNGKEVANLRTVKVNNSEGADRPSATLDTIGTFGPILSAVILDVAASANGLTWTRWERGNDAPLAVLRYVIPADKSHYQVVTCCLPDGEGTTSFQKVVGYHGEMTIEPSNGTILRLTLDADLKQSEPAVRSDIMVEYGSVQIGPDSHTCPITSVSILRGRTIRELRLLDASFRTFGPFVTSLNDVAFGHYHLFRTDSRILPGFSSVQ